MVMTRDLAATMRILEPAPGVLGFYDGRLPGKRLWSDAPNWLDDGAYELGICTYAILDGDEALVYDTHISLDHARIIRATLEARGVRHIRVVLSHWHDDHVAGNEIFSDCEIIANRRTAELLAQNRATIEAAEPPIRPLIMPNRLFDDRLDLAIGGRRVALHRMDIHSEDGTVMVLSDAGLLFAGDTLEDPITYVAEPTRLAAHLAEIDRLAGLSFTRILPDHGAEAVIAAGGYHRGFLEATHRYVSGLLAARTDPALAALPLVDWIAEDVARGAIRPFAPYEAVHRRNLAAVLEAATCAASSAPAPG
ncbi:MAG TPA: MBL fold metallo-hydrolase [Acidisoma sp.]|uniref:MBL fold metallo-hydrolase n=1 Tax=Acidisoma sp. TaxID=1872115 RepID=UPI002B670BF4|nr:MBL fold metallo-hydrolase [Acidisoma sp.]HTI00102.1 MBL fold metallo-hydrolase [Acidisoma sp.]